MANYRHVHCAFWQDSFILELTPEEKFFYLYLMTNPRTTQCGVYVLPLRVIEMEIGYNRETVSKLIKRFEDYGKVKYDPQTKEVCLLNWLKYNLTASPKVMGCVANESQIILNSEFRKLVTRQLSEKKKKLDRVSNSNDRVSPGKGEKEKSKKEKDTTEGTGTENQEINTESTQPSLCQRKKFSDEDMRCARWIFEQILLLNPGNRKPSFESWADTIRLMRERDGRTHREICALFAWANNDEFWKTNILSPGKLREKWDELVIKSKGAYEFIANKAFTPEQQVVVDAFNRHCAEKHGAAKHWSVKRAQAVAAVLKEGLVANWDTFFLYVAKLNIPGTIGFDWLMDVNNLIKVKEGVYE